MQSVVKWLTYILIFILLLGAAGVAYDMQLTVSQWLVASSFGIWLFVISNFELRKNRDRATNKWMPVIIVSALFCTLLIAMSIEIRITGKTIGRSVSLLDRGACSA